MSKGMEIGGIALGISGWILSIVACVLPMWRDMVFVTAKIIMARNIWQGLWMNCVVEHTGHTTCMVYDNVLALPQEIQASRAMTVIVIVLAFLGVMIYIIGTKCTKYSNCSKAKWMIISSTTFINAGILELIPVSWVTHRTIQDYNPIPDTAYHRQLGASIYIGFGASTLLLFGGALLCCTRPSQEKYYKMPKLGYSAPCSVRMDQV